MSRHEPIHAGMQRTGALCIFAVVAAAGLGYFAARSSQEPAARPGPAALPFAPVPLGAQQQPTAEMDDHDVAAAVIAALRLDGDARSAALARIAARWAARDPRAALDNSVLIRDATLRAEFRAAVVRAWARSDPEALVVYATQLDSAGQTEVLTVGGLEAFALIEPGRALELAALLPSELTAIVRRSALLHLARNEPARALRYTDALPHGPERDAALSAIAAGYARTDPESALAWAQSLEPPAPAVLANVLAGIADTDPERALDLAFSITGSTDSFAVLQTLVSSAALDARATARILERLAARPRLRGALHAAADSWVRRAPHAALDWMLANPSFAAPRNFGLAAERLGREDPRAALALLAQIPIDLQGRWLSSIADGHAQVDPNGAAAWVDDYRGRPGYEAALAAVAAHKAEGDPLAAARLLQDIDYGRTPNAASAAASVATHWAAEDPAAAAAWAITLPQDEARARAIAAVIERVARTDPAAARLLAAQYANDR